MTNLLVNGSFEASAVQTNGFGAFPSVAGWTALSGSAIELWNALNTEQCAGHRRGELRRARLCRRP
jgi:hypothetical protein